MTRKHFVAVAGTIRDEVDAATAAGDPGTVTALHRVALALCVTFKNDNSAFDRTRFLTACGF